MNDIEDKLDKVKERLTKVRHISEDVTQNMENAARIAIAPLTGRVRAYLLDNLKASGIKSRSGNLAKAVGESNVWVVIKNFKFVLRYGFARGLDNDVYVYGASLNFGATHGASDFSSRGRKKIKKGLMSQGQSTGGGGVHITKAYSFYKLNPGQLSEIKNEFGRNLSKFGLNADGFTQEE